MCKSVTWTRGLKRWALLRTRRGHHVKCDWINSPSSVTNENFERVPFPGQIQILYALLSWYLIAPYGKQILPRISSETRSQGLKF